MIIRINDINNKETPYFQINVKQNDIIKDIRIMIAKMIKWNCIKLVYFSSILEDNKTLNYYGIKDYSTINLITTSPRCLDDVNFVLNDQDLQ